MAVTLIVDEDVGDLLQDAFADALPGGVCRLPTYAVPEGGLAHMSRWRLCVGPEIGRRIKHQGWRDGLIFAISRQELEFVRSLLGPRDSLLFHDVAPERLKSAVRLAVAGLTLFPSDLAPENETAAPVLVGFEQLSEEDRSVLSELALGLGNQQIAARLGVPVEVARQSVNRIFRKLGCRNRTEVAVIAHGRLRPFLELPAVLPPEALPPEATGNASG